MPENKIDTVKNKFFDIFIAIAITSLITFAGTSFINNFNKIPEFEKTITSINSKLVGFEEAAKTLNISIGAQDALIRRLEIQVARLEERGN